MIYINSERVDHNPCFSTDDHALNVLRHNLKNMNLNNEEEKKLLELIRNNDRIYIPSWLEDTEVFPEITDILTTWIKKNTGIESPLCYFIMTSQLYSTIKENKTLDVSLDNAIPTKTSENTNDINMNLISTLCCLLKGLIEEKRKEVLQFIISTPQITIPPIDGIENIKKMISLTISKYFDIKEEVGDSTTTLIMNKNSLMYFKDNIYSVNETDIKNLLDIY